MPPMPMVVPMQTNAVQQAEKDLQTLKDLKKEEYPANVLCPMCEKRGITETTKTTSIMQYVACLGIFSVGCGLGCCFVPFCVDSMKDTVHKCSGCKHVLGRKSCL
jgi:lipopolysaccharide-induced tumor necrosis factor-alpha factor